MTERKAKRTDQIHAMMIAAGVSPNLQSKDEGSNLLGTLTDKINVENFCYNYQGYVLHPTLQFSEGDANKIKRPSKPIDPESAPPAPDAKPQEVEQPAEPAALPSRREHVHVEGGLSKNAAPAQEEEADLVHFQEMFAGGQVMDDQTNQAYAYDDYIEQMQLEKKKKDLKIYYDVNNADEKVKIRDAIQERASKKLRKFLSGSPSNTASCF